MATQADDRAMISERVAPGMLPRVLNSFDMTIIFVAIVLFIVNASAIQQAHQAAYTYWILGFLAFLIPGALVTAQLGQMFPQEGSLYVWTQKALGPFWGFFAGFCAWWPGILVMVATGDAVVTIRFYRRKDGGGDYEVLDKRGPLHVLRQPSPWSLTAGFAERLKDALTSLLPGK